MIWPKSTDYAEAVQNLRTSMTDEELRDGEVACNSLGLPVLWAGNFADVYRIHCPATGNTWALKCFTREARGRQERYREIASHLDRARLPFTVDFQYLEQGIRIGGARFPVLKMRWVEGQTLTQFVEEQMDRPRNLKMLLDLWVKLAARLREAQVAHADLQHGNVLLVPMSGGSLALRLIDYDGMHVPALAGTQSGELGHPAYQHPQRLREGTYNLEVDRFSHLVIYGSVHCLSVGQRELWDRFNNGDNLLFREADFQEPGKSELFRDLWELGDNDTRALTGRLVLACRRPLTESPLLDEIVTDGHIQPLSPGKLSAVESLLSTGKTVPIRAPAKPELTAARVSDSDLRSPAGLPRLSTEQLDSIPSPPVASSAPAGRLGPYRPPGERIAYWPAWLARETRSFTLASASSWLLCWQPACLLVLQCSIVRCRRNTATNSTCSTCPPARRAFSSSPWAIRQCCGHGSYDNYGTTGTGRSATNTASASTT